LTRLAKRQQLRVKKFTRGIRRQVREYQRKQRAELRVRRREFGRVVIAGEQLAEEFEKGVRVPDPGSSRPGQPPRMRTGKGRKSITVEIRMKGQKPEGVYVDKTVAPYMAMWEFRQDGKQRPFLRPSVMDHLSEYGQQVVKAGAQLRGSNKRRALVK
jgi:hypothetical protein